MENNNQTTYKAFVFCTNCHFREQIDIPKGSLINDVSCPNCGNLTIKVDPNGEAFSNPRTPISFI